MSSEIKEALSDAQREVEEINSLDLYDGDSLRALGYFRSAGQRHHGQPTRKELDYSDLVHMSCCRKQWCKKCKEVTRMVNQHSTKHASPLHQCALSFCGQLLALMKEELVLTPGPCLDIVQHIRQNMADIIANFPDG